WPASGSKLSSKEVVFKVPGASRRGAGEVPGASRRTGSTEAPVLPSPSFGWRPPGRPHGEVFSMFDGLQNKLQDVFRNLKGEGKVTPESLEAALRQIRLTLLEADVHIRVVKPFVDRVRERALGQEVLESLTPAQQVVKVVRDELAALLGD